MGPLYKLTLVLAALIGTLSACPAQSDGIRIVLSIDWKSNARAQADAMSLVHRGSLPLPLIFVDGQLRAMLEDGIAIDFQGRSEGSIDVGILQFIERPLYSLKVTAQSDSTLVNVVLTYPPLVQSQSKSSTGISQQVLKMALRVF